MATKDIQHEGWARDDSALWHYYSPNPAGKAACGEVLKIGARLDIRPVDQWHSSHVDCPACVRAMIFLFSVMVKPDSLKYVKGDVG